MQVVKEGDWGWPPWKCETLVTGSALHQSPAESRWEPSETSVMSLVLPLLVRCAMHEACTAVCAKCIRMPMTQRLWGMIALTAPCPGNICH